MKKIIIVISAILVIAVVGILFNSRGKQQFTSVPTSTFLPVLEQQIDALNNKDIDSYMQTIHEGSPFFESTKSLLVNQFKNYNQTFKLVSWEVVGATNDEIKVKVVQTTKNAEGSEKKDTKVTATHTLRKSGNSWKIYSTVIDKTEYLE